MRVTLLIKESYLETIRNSINSHMFKTLWANVDGKKEDIIDNGRRSCGVFTSGILIWFGLIHKRHATISGTLKDMKNSGWFEIFKPKIGCMLHWEKQNGNGESNEHIGFYMGDDMAISTSTTERTPIEHHWTYGVENNKPKRKVIKMYWHPKFDL